MLITTPEELRAFLPSHTYRNLDTVRGYLQNSELTFLRQRIGQPLLDALNEKYAEIGPVIGLPIGTEGSVEDDQSILSDPWRALIVLCQRCIVYDAFARASDIMAISANDMGLNIAESENFDAANDKRVDRYKAQLVKEAHAATDLLFIQLEAWEREVSEEGRGMSEESTTDAPEAGTDTDVPEAGTDTDAPEAGTDPEGNPDSSLSTLLSSLKKILSLWKQSPTCYLCTGLLFTTATEFNQFVDIYDSRERFITLLPDIRYCQELHLEAEVGPELLAYLHDGHRAGNLSPVLSKGYTMLQRCLSLYVEARAKMFNRPAARDEAQGYMHITLAYLRKHQCEIPYDIISLSPLYNPALWYFDETTNQYMPLSSVTSAPSSPHHSHCLDPNGASTCAKRDNSVSVFDDQADYQCSHASCPGPDSSAHGGAKANRHSQCDCGGTMLISSLI